MTSRTESSSLGLPTQSAQTLAQALGWFSIGLGMAELLAPRTLARSLGMEGSETLLRAYGAREIATGIGILASKNPAPWLWGRVAGDAVDLATLAAGLKGDNPQKMNVGLAIAAVAGVTALDVICAQSLTVQEGQPRQITRDYGDRTGFPRPAAEMRGAARDFEVPADFRVPALMRPYTIA